MAAYSGFLQVLREKADFVWGYYKIVTYLLTTVKTLAIITLGLLKK